jgi:hypothetical protein
MGFISRREQLMKLAAFALSLAFLLPIGIASAQEQPSPAASAAPAASAQPAASAADNAAALQAAAANPLAALISVPIQFNANYDVGPYHQFGYTMNLQPVVPLAVSDKTTVIFRTVIPFTYVPQLNKAPLVGNIVGLGQINPQFYFIPSHAGSLTIGPGVTFLLPTSTNPLVGTNKWAAGPDIAVIATTKTTIAGFIANNVWSFAGSPQGVDINSFFIQGVYVKNFAHGVGLTIQSQTTANWEAPGDQKWTVPIFLGINQLQKAGRQPLQMSGGIGYNVIRPMSTATWFARFSVSLLYPTAK